MLFKETFVVTILVFVVNAAFSPENMEKIGKTIHDIMEKCQKTENVSPDELFAFSDPRVPLPTNLKCLLACFSRETELRVDGNEVTDKFGYTELIKRDDPEYYRIYTEIMKECDSEVPKIDDQCEYSGRLFNCHMQKAQDMRLPIPNF